MEVDTKWGFKAILLLIESYKEYQDDFMNGVRKKHGIWRDIAKRMGEFGYNYSSQACDVKFRGLKSRYKTIKSDSKLSERDESKQWPYFAYLEDVFDMESDEVNFSLDLPHDFSINSNASQTPLSPIIHTSDSSTNYIIPFETEEGTHITEENHYEKADDGSNKRRKLSPNKDVRRKSYINKISSCKTNINRSLNQFIDNVKQQQEDNLQDLHEEAIEEHDTAIQELRDQVSQLSEDLKNERHKNQKINSQYQDQLLETIQNHYKETQDLQKQIISLQDQIVKLQSKLLEYMQTKV